MKFEALPGIPKNWMDFICGRRPDVSVGSFAGLLESLRDRCRDAADQLSLKDRKVEIDTAVAVSDSRRMRERIQRLEKASTVAVVASIDPDLFGGRLAQFLKCVTAAKICEELSRNSIESVAICWIRSNSIGDPSRDRMVRFLDFERRLRRLDLRETPSVSARPCRSIVEMIAAMEAMGGGSFDPEILSALKREYGTDAPNATALARLLAGLMETLDILVVDSGAPGFRAGLEGAFFPFLHPGGKRGPGQPEDTAAALSRAGSVEYYLQCLAFPVSLCILDPCDLDPYTEARSVLESCCGAVPLAWPAVSATLVDPVSRRILSAYQLQVTDLFTGEAKLLESLEKRLPLAPAADAFDILRSEADRRLDALQDPALDNRAFRKTEESCRRRIAFQLDKIRGRFEKAGSERLQVMQRRIARLCASLAPGGSVQERSLSGIFFLLRFSRTLLPLLCEKLDVEAVEHQVIDIN